MTNQSNRDSPKAIKMETGKQNGKEAILLTQKEVAAWFRVSENTLAQWRWRGEGPGYIKVGGAVRYLQSDLIAWLSDQRRRHTSEPGR